MQTNVVAAFLLLILYVGLIVVVGFMAAARNRMVVGYVLLCLIISPFIVMIILACIGEYSNFSNEEYYRERSRNEELSRRVQELEQKVADTKQCPSCAQAINKDVEFCPSCGCNVGEIEAKEKEKRRQEFEEKGLSVLLEDTAIMEEAEMLRRLYGKSAYVSHLKEKAKERGLGDIELSEQDLDSLIPNP